jgi:hypothetical protein
MSVQSRKTTVIPVSRTQRIAVPAKKERFKGDVEVGNWVSRGFTCYFFVADLNISTNFSEAFFVGEPDISPE